MADDKYDRLLGCITALQTAVTSLIQRQSAKAQGEILSDLQILISQSTGTPRGEYRAGLEEVAESIIKNVRGRLG